MRRTSFFNRKGNPIDISKAGNNVKLPLAKARKIAQLAGGTIMQMRKFPHGKLEGYAVIPIV